MKQNIDLQYPCKLRIQSTVTPETMTSLNDVFLSANKQLKPKKVRAKKVVEQVWEKNKMRRVV